MGGGAESRRRVTLALDCWSVSALNLSPYASQYADCQSSCVEKNKEAIGTIEQSA